MKILIVDDDSITQKLLKGLLEKQGHDNVLISNSKDVADKTLQIEHSGAGRTRPLNVKKNVTP
jgi:CheY-like chemotaxis protein